MYYMKIFVKYTVNVYYMEKKEKKKRIILMQIKIILIRQLQYIPFSTTTFM